MNDLKLDANYSTHRNLLKNDVPFAGNFGKCGGLRTKGWIKKTTESKPLISVITVVRNDVNHIEETILSVLNQTYDNVEYIVIDGNSNDGTSEIIQKYGAYIDLWVSEPDPGVLYGFNKGVDQVTGSWAEFLNSGDFFFNNTVLSDVMAEKKGGADLLYGNAVGHVNGRRALIEAHDDVVENAWQGMKLIHETVFVKAEILKELKFDTKYRVSADGDFILKCISKGYKFQRTNVVVFETRAQGFSANHWFLARKENWQIARKYYPGFRTDWFNLRGLVYFVVFRFFKQILSAVGIYGLLRKYYRSWIGDKKMREKYKYNLIDDNKKL